MKIELVEVYKSTSKEEQEESPKETGDLTFSAHVYLVDIAADLRGVLIRRRANKWDVRLPTNRLRYLKNVDGKIFVGYPIFIFTDEKKNEALMEAIKAEAIPYIEEKFLKEKEEKKKKKKVKEE